ncbi:hypothetical protein NYE69_24685 [Paenibacillus sp. FSL R5-0527]
MGDPGALLEIQRGYRPDLFWALIFQIAAIAASIVAYVVLQEKVESLEKC